MRDHSLDAVKSAGAEHCSEKCLKNQLDEYYKNCKGKGVSANPGEAARSSDSSGGSTSTDTGNMR
ncbi:hypothetical protein D9M68_694440 [compost metagenome]